MTTDVGSFKSYQLIEGRTTPVSVRVSPTEKIRAEIDALIAGERELGEVIEDVARLRGAASSMSSAAGPARRAGQAAPERRLPGVRAGDLDGARFRVPLRLPRPAAHGDHQGAA